MKKLFSILIILFLLFMVGCSNETSFDKTSSSETNSNETSPKENEKNLVKSVNIGTHTVGGAYYAMGTGVAKIITKNTSIQATVLPYAGPDAWMPDMRDGVVNLGIISGCDLAWAYKGEVVYPEPTSEIRLVLTGNKVPHCTFTVLENSEINSISALKGKKVGYEYGGNKFTNALVDSALASVGLTIDDCQKVPLTDLATAQRALQEHRVDAIFTGSPTTPSSVQLDQSIGLKVLPFGDLTPDDIANGIPEKYQSILDQFVPGATLDVAPQEGTLKEETVLIHYPIDLAASSKLSENTVYTILAAIYKDYPDLASANKWGLGWIPKNFTTDKQPAPYHAGSVKLFKEKGVWTDSMEARQKELLQN